jgi:hypothetical protein
MGLIRCPACRYAFEAPTDGAARACPQCHGSRMEPVLVSKSSERSKTQEVPIIVVRKTGE